MLNQKIYVSLVLNEKKILPGWIMIFFFPVINPELFSESIISFIGIYNHHLVKLLDVFEFTFLNFVCLFANPFQKKTSVEKSSG